MNTFSPHTVAESAKVNQNFTGLSDGTMDTLANSLQLARDELLPDCVISGCTIPTSANLTTTNAAGVIILTGYRLVIASIGKTYTASKDTYVDINSSGAYIYTEVANGATTGMTLTAGNIRVAKVVTSGVAITSVIQYGSDPLGNIVYPKSPAVIMRTYCLLGSGTAAVSGSATALVSAVGSLYPFNEVGEELADPTGMHSISSNPSRVTIANPGIYEITGNCFWPDNVTGVRINEIIKNGATTSGSNRAANDSAGRSAGTAYACLQLVAGDYVEFSLYQSSGGNLTPQSVSFSVKLLQ